MKGIVLTMLENNKYEIIKNLVDNNGNKHRAALKLNCSIRTINRLIANYIKYGKAAFRHKNHDNKPISTLSAEIVNQVINLYSNKYKDFNFSHFNQFLKSNENIFISYNALYNILTNNGFLSPKARRKTKRNHYKKTSIPHRYIVDDVLITNNESSLLDSHPRQERAKYFGEVVQMDASQHLWFGNKKAHLHLAIDDASSCILAAFFDRQETLNGYYTILNSILSHYGIPNMFLTDNRTIFAYNSLKAKSLDKDTFTQFSFACSILGTSIKTSSIPQSKGKVERSFNTHQDRLINELKLMNITTIEEANEYLNQYIVHHNNLFALPLKDITSVFEKQPSKETINLILSIRTERIVDNGNSIRYKNKYYQPYDENNRFIPLKPKSKAMVIEAYDGNLYLESADISYLLKEVSLHKEVSKEFDLDASNKQIEKTLSIPSKDHPWRHFSIKAHQSQIHGKIKTLEEYYDDCLPLE